MKFSVFNIKGKLPFEVRSVCVCVVFKQLYQYSKLDIFKVSVVDL